MSPHPTEYKGGVFMKIAVIGADTRLGRRIAKEALHRHNDVTAVV